MIQYKIFQFLMLHKVTVLISFHKLHTVDRKGIIVEDTNSYLVLKDIDKNHKIIFKNVIQEIIPVIQDELTDYFEKPKILSGVPEYKEEIDRLNSIIRQHEQFIKDNEDELTHP